MNGFQQAILRASFEKMTAHVAGLGQRDDWRQVVDGFRHEMNGLEQALRALDPLAADPPPAMPLFPQVPANQPQRQPKSRRRRSVVSDAT